MSVKWMAQVWESGPEDKAELIVLLALADFADDAGNCWPSMISIGRKARMSERNARRVVRQLEADGYVETVPGGGRMGCSQYRLNPDKMSVNSPRKPGQNVRPKNPDKMSPPRTKRAENPDTAMSAEPSRTVIKQEQQCASAREPISPDDFLRDVMAACGVKGHPIPAYWMPPASTIHVMRWVTDLGLSRAEVLQVAEAGRLRFPDPPNGPKALDRRMREFATAKASAPMSIAPQGARPADAPTTASLIQQAIENDRRKREEERHAANHR